MKTNHLGIELIKSFEGYREKAYKCPAGIWTVGYGTTKGVKPTSTMTREQAEEALERDLEKFEDGVRILVEGKATSNQFSAMVCLAYNIGTGAFARSSVLRYHKAGEFRKAADAFLMWNKAAGHVLPGLVRRREAERELYIAR